MYLPTACVSEKFLVISFVTVENDINMVLPSNSYLYLFNLKLPHRPVKKPPLKIWPEL